MSERVQFRTSVDINSVVQVMFVEIIFVSVINSGYDVPAASGLDELIIIFKRIWFRKEITVTTEGRFSCIKFEEWTKCQVYNDFSVRRKHNCLHEMLKLILKRIVTNVMSARWDNEICGAGLQ